jgi:hypothetical protein
LTAGKQRRRFGFIFESFLAVASPYMVHVRFFRHKRGFLKKIIVLFEIFFIYSYVILKINLKNKKYIILIYF